MTEQKPEEHEQNVEIVTIHDPVWSPALNALTRDSNTRPLAELLRQGLAPPDMVTAQLAIMLDPPEGYRGATLIPKYPKRDWRAAVRSMSKDRRLRAKILNALEKNGKLESAITEVMSETGLSRARLFQAWRLTDREVVVRSQKLLGYDAGQSQTKRYEVLPWSAGPRKRQQR